jgi:hypothetical protein
MSKLDGKGIVEHEEPGNKIETKEGKVCEVIVC